MHSHFAEDGSLREEHRSQVVLAEYLHLAGVQWAADPDGSDHCEWLSRCCEYLAGMPEGWGGVVGGPMSPHDVKVLHATAMLYCTGRTSPSSGPIDSAREEVFAGQSAANAERFFREGGGYNTYFGREDVREDVCRLIYRFGQRFRDRGMISSDKRLQVLSDCVDFEVARYAPNTGEGMRLIRERFIPERTYTGFAKSKDNFRAWMRTRGWK